VLRLFEDARAAGRAVEVRLRRAFGGARRDEEKSRAKSGIYSFRDAYGQWDPRTSGRSLWNIYNSKLDKGETIEYSRCRTGPSWTFGSTSTSRISRSCRCISRRNGRWSSAASRCCHRERPATDAGRAAEDGDVTHALLGCTPCTGAIRSSADTLPKIIEELFLMRRSERENRIIDHDQEGSMEIKKREGYF
jgi:sulfate adenylyltransferase subunit 2